MPRRKNLLKNQISINTIPLLNDSQNAMSQSPSLKGLQQAPGSAESPTQARLGFGVPWISGSNPCIPPKWCNPGDCIAPFLQELTAGTYSVS